MVDLQRRIDLNGIRFPQAMQDDPRNSDAGALPESNRSQKFSGAEFEKNFIVRS
jgi:hypothetical protein